MVTHEHTMEVVAELVRCRPLLGRQHRVELFERFGTNRRELTGQLAGISRELIDFGTRFAGFCRLPQGNARMPKLLGDRPRRLARRLPNGFGLPSLYVGQIQLSCHSVEHLAALPLAVMRGRLCRRRGSRGLGHQHSRRQYGRRRKTNQWNSHNCKYLLLG